MTKVEKIDKSRKNIPVEESFAAWRKEPEYVAAYNALEGEFWFAMAAIEAGKFDERGEDAGGC